MGMQRKEAGHQGGLESRVAAEIRAELARRQMQQAELAEKLGVDPSWVSRRLGESRRITIDDLERIAQALEIGAADLLAGAQPEGARGYRVIPSAGQTASENRPDDRPSQGEGSPGRASSPRRPRRLIPAQRAMPQQRLAAA